jgi:predicted ATPase/predicted Ser/Thr protein kinase
MIRFWVLTEVQMIGETVSHYKILAKLGEGGMGVVYKAEDTRLLRPVALKFVAAHALASEGARERFVQEARAAAACDHPHICTIYEIDEVEGRTFIAMAYVEGRDLDEVIAEGPLEPDRAIVIASQVADGLSAAHARGIVHRDIKPANIMVGADGQARIMDFGLAETGSDAKLTRPATAAGTIAYMSPERTRGHGFDHRTDIWSLGVVLYEMLTGELPFRGGTDQAFIYSLFHDEPPPLDEEALGAPRGLAAVVARALAKDPEERYQDVGAMLTDLRAVSVGGPAVGSRLRAGPATAGNLPVQLSRFIGRREEIELALHLLRENRFLTLTGAGGCGKTRMAIEVAEALLPEVPDGAWFADLAPLTDPDLVPQAVAEALGLKESPDEGFTESVVSHLRPKTALIVLDNCEHLLLPCATLAERLLRTCPSLRILATSQEAIGIAGEIVYQVLTLAVPPAKGGLPLEKIASTEAIALFVDRARAAQAQFALTEENAPAVVQVCRRLDGIPLALELAAARVKALPVEEIARRLDDRFRLLTSGKRTSLPRHQTLEALVGWSYEHLEPAEQTLFRRLSVFAGGLSLESAEAVCSGDGIESADVLDLASRLIERSLVTADAASARAGEPRYGMLETLRAYAHERLLEDDALPAVVRRHGEHFLALAEEAEAHLIGGEEQTTWFARLGREHDNLRAALEGFLGERGDPARALRLVGALGPYWTYRGHWTEGRNACRRALARSGAGGRTAERAKALSWAGMLAFQQSDHDAARGAHGESLAIRRELADDRAVAESLHNLAMVEREPERQRVLYEESLAIARAVGDGAQVTRTLNNLGILALSQGDHPRARALFEEALALLRETGNRSGEAVTLGNLGEVSLKEGDYTRARALYEECRAISEALRDPQSEAWSLNCLGRAAAELGDLAGARDSLAESLSMSREIGDRGLECWSLTDLGRVARLEGNPGEAARLYDEALALARDLGERSDEALILMGLGLVALGQGDPARARSLLVESLGMAVDLGDPHEVARGLEAFAALAVADDPARAVRLFGAAESLRERIPSPLSPSGRAERDAHVSVARAALGDELFSREWAAGRRMSPEEAVETALS